MSVYDKGQGELQPTPEMQDGEQHARKDPYPNAPEQLDHGPYQIRTVEELHEGDRIEFVHLFDDGHEEVATYMIRRLGSCVDYRTGEEVPSDESMIADFLPRAGSKVQGYGMTLRYTDVALAEYKDGGWNKYNYLRRPEESRRNRVAAMLTNLLS